MALQPATRRLLTEAAGAAAYRTAAQVDTAADARIAAKRGAANGVAALGADGLVPSAQLPPPTSLARGVVAAATVASGVLAAAGAAATALQLTPTLDPTRVYEVQLTGVIAGSGAMTVTARALAGATAPTSATGTPVGYATAASTSAAPPLLGRFTIGTAGIYTLAFHVAGAQASAVGTVPAVASVADVGPKVAGLPAVP